MAALYALALALAAIVVAKAFVTLPRWADVAVALALLAVQPLGVLVRKRFPDETVFESSKEGWSLFWPLLLAALALAWDGYRAASILAGATIVWLGLAATLVFVALFAGYLVLSAIDSETAGFRGASIVAGLVTAGLIPHLNATFDPRGVPGEARVASLSPTDRGGRVGLEGVGEVAVDPVSYRAFVVGDRVTFEVVPGLLGARSVRRLAR
jgi:hypothetical protein